MSDSDISFSGQTVSLPGQTWQAPWPVKQAVVIDGRVILLYDYMAGPRHHQFQNLEAFSLYASEWQKLPHSASRLEIALNYDPETRTVSFEEQRRYE